MIGRDPGSDPKLLNGLARLSRGIFGFTNDASTLVSTFSYVFAHVLGAEVKEVLVNDRYIGNLQVGTTRYISLGDLVQRAHSKELGDVQSASVAAPMAAPAYPPQVSTPSRWAATMDVVSGMSPVSAALGSLALRAARKTFGPKPSPVGSPSLASGHAVPVSAYTGAVVPVASGVGFGKLPVVMLDGKNIAVETGGEWPPDAVVEEVQKAKWLAQLSTITHMLVENADAQKSPGLTIRFQRALGFRDDQAKSADALLADNVDLQSSLMVYRDLHHPLHHTYNFRPLDALNHDGAQFLLALDKTNYSTWGRWYLLSLLRALDLDYCPNAKDLVIFEGMFARGMVFTTFVEQFAEAYSRIAVESAIQHAMTAAAAKGLNIQQSQAAVQQAAVKAAAKADQDTSGEGGCFGKGTQIWVEAQDGIAKQIAIEDVKKGDKVLVFDHRTNQISGTSSVLVVMESPASEYLLQLSEKTSVTAYHPVMNNGAWAFPIDLGLEKITDANEIGSWVYNLLLANEEKSILSGGDSPKEAEVCSVLGHGMTGPTIGHRFFSFIARDRLRTLSKNFTHSPLYVKSIRGRLGLIEDFVLLAE